MQEEVFSELRGKLADLVCRNPRNNTAPKRYHLLPPSLVKVEENCSCYCWSHYSLWQLQVQYFCFPFTSNSFNLQVVVDIFLNFFKHNL